MSPLNKKNDLLQKDIRKLFFPLSLPGIAGMLMIAANAMIDAIYAGRLIGPDALAGIAVTIPLLIINTAVTNLIAGGSASLLSRSIGANDQHVLQHIFRNVLLLCSFFSVVLTCLGCLLSAQLVAWMGVKGSILESGIAYYQTMMAGMFFSCWGLCSSALIRAEGRIRYAMTVTAVAVVLNAAIHPFFISVLHLGVKGSAYATIFSMFVYCVLNLFYFLKKNTVIGIGRSWFYADTDIISRILTVGFSVMLMQVNSFIRQVILFRTLSCYSSEAQFIFFSAVYRIFSFSIVPMFGILQGLQPLVGMNFGAGNHQRAVQAVKIFRAGAIGLMMMIALPSFIFPKTILSLLLPGYLFTAIDTFHFRMILLLLPLAPVASTSIVFLQATGQARISAYLSAGREFLLFLPLILLIPFIASNAGIYHSLLVEAILYMFIVLVVINRRFKHTLNSAT